MYKLWTHKQNNALQLPHKTRYTDRAHAVPFALAEFQTKVFCEYRLRFLRVKIDIVYMFPAAPFSIFGNVAPLIFLY